MVQDQRPDTRGLPVFTQWGSRSTNMVGSSSHGWAGWVANARGKVTASSGAPGERAGAPSNSSSRAELAAAERQCVEPRRDEVGRLGAAENGEAGAHTSCARPRRRHGQGVRKSHRPFPSSETRWGWPGWG